MIVWPIEDHHEQGLLRISDLIGRHDIRKQANSQSPPRAVDTNECPQDQRIRVSISMIADGLRRRRRDRRHEIGNSISRRSVERHQASPRPSQRDPADSLIRRGRQIRALFTQHICAADRSVRLIEGCA